MNTRTIIRRLKAGDVIRWQRSDDEDQTDEWFLDKAAIRLDPSIIEDLKHNKRRKGRIVPAGDALFPDFPSQTWIWTYDN